ncbi:MAG TPA: ATP-grasp domain-containing protein, partial [Actinomycetales bacterium]|nr:ATP-grasp domain-containing protein [Actinomycetales bacterium]
MGYTVAVVGGGQLARMMQEAASALGITLRALVEDAGGSAGQVVPVQIEGAAKDEAALRAIAEGADALTVEHEHLDPAQLRRLGASGIPVHPGPDALLYAQDKLAMRARLEELGVEVPAWTEVRDAAGLEEFGERAGWPVVVKTPRGGYDGKGVRLARASSDVADWLEGIARGQVSVDGLGGAGGEALLVEEYVPFTRELAALVARRPSGEMRAWPVVETVQADGVCSEVLAPAPGLDPAMAERAQRMALAIAEGLGVVGVLAVELFAVEG